MSPATSCCRPATFFDPRAPCPASLMGWLNVAQLRELGLLPRHRPPRSSPPSALPPRASGFLRSHRPLARRRRLAAPQRRPATSPAATSSNCYAKPAPPAPNAARRAPQHSPAAFLSDRWPRFLLAHSPCISHESARRYRDKSRLVGASSALRVRTWEFTGHRTAPRSAFMRGPYLTHQIQI